MTPFYSRGHWWVREHDGEMHGPFISEGKANAFVAEELFPQPDRNRTGKEPCGECHIQPGETCDICGAKAEERS